MCLSRSDGLLAGHMGQQQQQQQQQQQHAATVADTADSGSSRDKTSLQSKILKNACKIKHFPPRADTSDRRYVCTHELRSIILSAHLAQSQLFYASFCSKPFFYLLHSYSFPVFGKKWSFLGLGQKGGRKGIRKPA